MVKPKTFITDEQWQRLNYRMLVEIAEDETMAKEIVAFLDDNPDIRNDLAGIYFRAKETLKMATK